MFLPGTDTPLVYVRTRAYTPCYFRSLENQAFRNFFLQRASSSFTETIRLIRDGRMEVGEEGDYVPIAVHCHHQIDSCVKIDCDESPFNVSLIVRDKVTRQCHRPQRLKIKANRSGIEPRSLC